MSKAIVQGGVLVVNVPIFPPCLRILNTSFLRCGHFLQLPDHANLTFSPEMAAWAVTSYPRLKPVTESWLVDRRLARDARLPPPAGPQLSTYVASRRAARAKEPELHHYPPHRLALGVSAEKVFAVPELLEQILLHLQPQERPAQLYADLDAVKELFAVERVSRSFLNTIEGSVGLRRRMGTSPSLPSAASTTLHRWDELNYDFAPYLAWRPLLLAPFGLRVLNSVNMSACATCTFVHFHLSLEDTAVVRGGSTLRLGMRGGRNNSFYTSEQGSWRRIVVSPFGARLTVKVMIEPGLSSDGINYTQRYVFLDAFDPERTTNPGTLGLLLDELQSLLLRTAKDHERISQQEEFKVGDRLKYMDSKRLEPSASCPPLLIRLLRALTNDICSTPFASSLGVWFVLASQSFLRFSNLLERIGPTISSAYLKRKLALRSCLLGRLRQEKQCARLEIRSEVEDNAVTVASAGCSSGERTLNTTSKKHASTDDQLTTYESQQDVQNHHSTMDISTGISTTTQTSFALQTIRELDTGDRLVALLFASIPLCSLLMAIKASALHCALFTLFGCVLAGMVFLAQYDLDIGFMFLVLFSASVVLASCLMAL